MKKRTKNLVLKTITSIALSINVIYFSYVMCTGNTNIGIMVIPWVLSIAWISLFIFANIDNWLKYNNKSYRKPIDNTKYYFKEKF